MRAFSDDDNAETDWTWAFEAVEVGAGVATGDDEDVEVVWTWAVAATEADEDCEAVEMVTGDTCNRAVDRVGFAIDDKETRDVALADPIREPSDEEKMLLLICFSIWY